jgi:hypothetical protein
MEMSYHLHTPAALFVGQKPQQALKMKNTVFAYTYVI